MTRTFLFSTAAVLVTATAASAADLPSKKAAPVEYVKVCKVGEGKMGFVVPGTDTCLQIGGFARFQYDATPTYHDRTADVSKFGAVGSLKAVAYNQTELGLLTGRVRIDVGAGGKAELDSAYIGLGGFSAGFFGSAYKFYDGAFGVGSAYSPSGAGNKPVQIQYALAAGPATFTLALEDRSETEATGFSTYAGQRVPDVVAAVDATFGIATLHLGAVAHQVSSISNNVDSKWGFAVLGGASAAFTASDTLYVEAAYSQGAVNRLEGISSVKSADYDIGDAVVDGTSLKLTSGYYGLAAFQHAWTPTFSTFVAASYLVIDLPKVGGVDKGGLDQLKLGIGATWTPVKNLSVSPELAYINANPDKTLAGTNKGSENNYTARLRIQRDF